MTLDLSTSLLTLAAEAASRSGPPWALLIPLLPLAACAVMGLFAALGVKSKLPGYLTVLALGASFALTLGVFTQFFRGSDATPVHVHGFDWLHFITNNTGTGDASPPFVANFAFHIDTLTCLWMLFVTGLATLIALYSTEYMSADAGLGYCRYFAAFNLFVFSMLCLVMADNLVLMFLGWEGVGLCSYLLIGYHYKRPEAVAAAKKAFIMNRIGDLGLLAAIFSIYLVFGTVEYARIFALVAADSDAAGNILTGTWVVKVIPLLIAAGAFGKSAQLFLYVWLPDAMEGPTPVSALIHAATMVTAGVFLVARMQPLFLADPGKLALTVVAWSGAITALWAATIGMAFFDIKRIMGYSTVSQLGYMFAGLGVFGGTGAVYHVFTHAFFKATLFLCCGAVMHGFAGQLDLRKLSGVGKLPGWRITAIAMLVGALNLAGFPFTAGFFSKDMILAQAFSTPQGTGIFAPSAIGWILLLTAGLTAYYTFRVFFRVFLGPVEYHAGEEAHGHDDHGHGHGHGHVHKAHDHHDHGHFHPHAPGWAMNLVMLTCAVLSILAAGAYTVKSNFTHAAPPSVAMIAPSDAPHAPHPADAHASHGGWVAGMVQASSAAVAAPHGGTIFGRDPHKVMYYVSGVVGACGIIAAWFLHLFGRKHAATAPADHLFNAVPGLETLHKWANGKWYVDEFYHFLIVRPLHVLSHVFHLVDQYLVDGVVNLVGAVPRWIARLLRPTQSGEVHGYALGMAGGVAVLLILVWWLTVT